MNHTVSSTQTIRRQQRHLYINSRRNAVGKVRRLSLVHQVYTLYFALSKKQLRMKRSQNRTGETAGKLLCWLGQIST